MSRRHRPTQRRSFEKDREDEWELEETRLVVLEEICECPRERAVLEAFCHAEFRVGSAAREFRCGDAFGLRVGAGVGP